MGTLLLSQKERRRREILSRVQDGELSVAEASGMLGISERQGWRLKRRHFKGGDAGLAHGLRGRASNRKTDAATRAAILKLYRAKYAGFGPTLAW
jgi:transposase